MDAHPSAREDYATSTDNHPTEGAQSAAKDEWLGYPLIDALRERRSRRFGMGMRIPGGPLAYESQHEPLPLTEEEIAILAFAACGITGPALGDWVWTEEAGGNMLANLIGRTVGSADAVHAVSLVVSNDQGTWLMRKPTDLPPAEALEVAELARAGEFGEAWRRVRVRLADHRLAPPVEPPSNINPNRWSLYAPGTTIFLPIAELTHMAINAVLELFNEHTGLLALDERRMFLPAGVGRFVRSRGGWLDDDPKSLKSMSVSLAERIATELAVVEIGMVLQNLYLACQALGLGGFSHYTFSDFSHADPSWFDALGFRTASMPLTKFFGVPKPASWLLKLRRQDVPIRYPVGLERDGKVLLRPYCPPYYPSMEAAVRAVVEFKLGPEGTYRAGIGAGAWKDPSRMSAGIPPVTEKGYQAVVAHCEYLWERYGRFPVYLPAFHTLAAFQAAHVDVDFYERFYEPGVLTDRHRSHLSRWH
jgi:hypothetical protein